MQFRVDAKIFESFPKLCLGVVKATGIDNSRVSEELSSLLAEEVKKVADTSTTETIQNDPRLIAWRDAFRAFKAKPKKYKCSVENLYRMIVGGTELGPINSLVDVYNVFSLRYCLPLGGDDLDKVSGDIVLCFAEGNERFIQLNSQEESSPKPGEVVYMDDEDVLCRRWNWRECDKSKMTNQTSNACLVIEGLPPFSASQISEITHELATQIQRFCGGQASTAVLSAENPSFDL